MPFLPYQESAPSDQLSPWIETFWQSPIEQDGVLRLLPSANTQLLAYSNARGSGLAIVGPMTKFQMTHVRAGNVFFGARLCIGVRLAMAGFTATGMKDVRVFGSELACSPIQAFETAFAQTPTRVRLDLLAQLVSSLIKQGYLKRDPLVDAFIARAFTANGNCSVEELAGDIPLSDRQLRRRFTQQTGMTPKTFLRICRQQAAVERLKQSTGTIAAIAAAHGYSDQAHFNNEFRELIGVTPLMLDDELLLT